MFLKFNRKTFMDLDVQEGLTIGFLFLYAFFIMLFFTQSSPFFVLNNWDDANAFFTVGKGMAHGLVPYKDLFEQKGPLLYALYELAYFVSHTNFFGVYLLESLAMFFDLLLAFKTACLYLQRMPSAFISLLFPTFILDQSVFYLGGSAEEFAIPFVMLFLYLMLKHFKLSHGEPFGKTFYLIGGLTSGCVLWIKFTLLGGWIGFYLVVLLISLQKRKWREPVRALLYTSAGLVLASAPWIVYFGIHHGVRALIDVYFKFNLSAYSSQDSMAEKLINCALTVGTVLDHNPVSGAVMLTGMIFFLFTWKYLRSMEEKWAFFCYAAGLVLGVYIGGRHYVYYFLIVLPLTLFGLIAIGGLLQKSGNKPAAYRGKRNEWPALIIFAMAAFFLCFGYNTNILSSKFFVRKPPVQENFAAIIDRERHPTLLNYGFLDGGFYLASNIVPNTRYFEKQNVKYKVYPENMNEQNHYVRAGLTQFVVVRAQKRMAPWQLRIPAIFKKYHIAAQQFQRAVGRTYRYILFKKN
ncbi:hypothetical protein [Sporolactobacillus sp. KGMB 08714]|uniref:hypothetical protein n=1 Tax=Sporolactobacillus sp. KGMB 08714 TaxID=3064704 RepID=UPI002FBDC137